MYFVCNLYAYRQKDCTIIAPAPEIMIYCMPDFVGNASEYVWKKIMCEKKDKKMIKVYITEEKSQ